MEVYNFINSLDFIPSVLLVMLLGFGVLNFLIALRGKPTKRIALKQSVNSYFTLWIFAIVAEAIIFCGVLVVSTTDKYSDFPLVGIAGVFTIIGFIAILSLAMVKKWELWKLTPEEKVIAKERDVEYRKQLKQFFYRVHLGFIGKDIKA